MKYVKVPEHAAQTLEDIKKFSRKGHNAEVKYDERSDKYTIYDVGKKKTERTAI